MAWFCATPLAEGGLEMDETDGVSGACKDPDDGVVVEVVEEEDVPSEICREGGAVNPPETWRSGNALALLLQPEWLQKNRLC